MADELDEIQQAIGAHAGFENDETGKIIVCFLEHVRQLTARVSSLETQLAAAPAAMDATGMVDQSVSAPPEPPT